MRKKEMIAMLLAGGQGSRLGVLTKKMAKPGVAFGGKYRIIDFPLSNCINSGIDTVGVLTQYRPLRLNTHIGIGIPWDLDRIDGGVSILPPYERGGDSQWYTGTANAVYQNLHYLETFSPEYVLILSGDHIYKMDYSAMLKAHKSGKATVSIAAHPVPQKEAGRYGILVANAAGEIQKFEEKPEKPGGDLASMGIYIFNWQTLREALQKLSSQPACDFGKHVIPYCQEKGERLFAYPYDGYWKDVGTLGAYWEANMALVDLVPEFNLYEENWRIYTNGDLIPPQYIARRAVVEKSIVSDGAQIYGEVYHSVISPGVVVGAGTVVRDSILMRDVKIGRNCIVETSILSEGSVVGERTTIGLGRNTKNRERPDVYCFGLATVGEESVIPAQVHIGKNTAIFGQTKREDYQDGVLESGGTLLKRKEMT